jgi:hypothetical protein
MTALRIVNDVTFDTIFCIALGLESHAGRYFSKVEILLT